MTAIRNCAILLLIVLFIAGSSGAQEISFSATAGEVTAPFLITTNGISQAELTGLTNGGRAVYTFTISSPGNFIIQAEVNAPSDQANSFYVAVDSEPQDPEGIWDIPVTNGFTLQTVSWRGIGAPSNSQAGPKTFHLAAGTHKLIIRGREPRAELRKLAVVMIPEPPANLRVFGGVAPGVPAPPRNLRIVTGP